MNPHYYNSSCKHKKWISVTLIPKPDILIPTQYSPIYVSGEWFSPLATTIIILRASFHLSNSHDPKVFCKNHHFLRYSIRMPNILWFTTDAFQNSHFKIYLAQLPSIYNTIQSNSDISSLNVWTTLWLGHSMPGGLWRGLTRHHFPIHIHMYFLLQTAA